jgi:hypothetical protein
MYFSVKDNAPGSRVVLGTAGGVFSERLDTFSVPKRRINPEIDVLFRAQTEKYGLSQLMLREPALGWGFRPSD